MLVTKMIMPKGGIEEIKRLLTEMRENCVSNRGGEAYNDPARMDKYEALNYALYLLDNPVNENTSDGYHTFKELYHHRAVLFSVIVRDRSEWCWKAKKHSDGTMFDGMFIVGIDTPHGQATYHYDIDPYWDMFHCEEYEFAPEWDGHTPQEAIDRIAKLDLGTAMFGVWKPIKEDFMKPVFKCGVCGYEYHQHLGVYHHCPGCGARMCVTYG